MQRPSPDQYNPPLTWRAHAWRTAAAILFSAVLWWTAAPLLWAEARGLFFLDLSLGLAALALSFFRRRWPFLIAVLTSVMGAVSITANGPGTLVKISLATRRVMWQIVVVGLLGLGASASIPMIQPTVDGFPALIDFLLGLLSAIAMLVGGMYIGSRRELLWTLRERAERAEADQELRVQQGKMAERARIAREMHDVLAHRMSLVAMHAGALAYRTDLAADEMRHTAELIQSKSHEALTDLRQVLGVLRQGEEPNGLPESPQPTFADVASLVLEAQASGMRIQYDDRVQDAEKMPDRVGRTTYRVIQEGLTNARKHAAGATVMVQVSGSTREGVSISIRNPTRSELPVNGASTPGAELGLIGLQERVKLADGQLSTHHDGASFELDGWLPWKP